MTEDELRAWIAKNGNTHLTRTHARVIFPDRPKGYVTVAKCLLGYAWNRVTALACQREGKPDKAIVYENICERIHRELPDFARW